MTHEIGGWLWMFMDVLLVVVLGGALAYGIVKWRQWRRRPEHAGERDQATRELFRDNGQKSGK